MVAAQLLLCLVSARWGVTPSAVEALVMIMTVCMALARMPTLESWRLFLSITSIPFTLCAWNMLLPCMDGSSAMGIHAARRSIWEFVGCVTPGRESGKE
ncbi:hypothetical protein B0H16DRAFT_1633830 [Mycena metata]|uniref:Secreted protein n=1 Tax=Mycena metata TaxID=1033252 RepID=A0AAD7GX94_9AGAR|nr:hypothetical protein B0H16DRAFT_1633830 [Mycena metata]